MSVAAVSGQPDLGTQHQFHGVQPVLPVSDVTRAARYFRDVLGFELDFIAGEPPSYARVRHVPPGAGCVGASPQGGPPGSGRPGAGRGDHSYGDAVYIRLWQSARRDAAPWRGEIVIHVGHDVDGLHRAYQQRGVVIVEPPVSQPWGLREFAIREPDGHLLRFCGYLDPTA